jgi:hypothetical protein
VLKTVALLIFHIEGDQRSGGVILRLLLVLVTCRMRCMIPAAAMRGFAGATAMTRGAHAMPLAKGKVELLLGKMVQVSVLATARLHFVEREACRTPSTRSRGSVKARAAAAVNRARSPRPRRWPPR